MKLFRKKNEEPSFLSLYPPEQYEPVIRSSICTGEKTGCVRNRETGRVHEIMLIRDAERFGLAQLHQLRGRVGRSDKQSYCIFMMNNASERSKERLDILLNSNDGFEIAAKDMELRGPGDIFGIRRDR